eukprot:gene18847-20745_t
MKSMDANRIDGYTWKNVLGEGAFATVVLCQRTQDDKLFAAKIMNFEKNRRLKWEAENEIEIMTDLRWHPYIVSLHEVIRGTHSTTLILEYVSSTSLFHGISNWAHFTEVGAQTTMKQLLSAISHCHRSRIIHRDISPLNILWVQHPTLDHPEVSPWLKIIDFNLARRIYEGSTQIECDPVGTDMFMSPEALQDRSIVGFPNDIWSLGVILFFCLSGYPPFWCDNYKHLLKNIEEGNYQMPKKHWSSVSTEGQELVKEMLNVKPSRRITADNALTHDWFRRHFYDDRKLQSERSLVQSRIVVYLDRTKPVSRGVARRQLKRTGFPKITPRRAYTPDKELEMQALQVKENNNI